MKKLLIIPLFFSFALANETATLIDIKESLYYLIKDNKELTNKLNKLEMKLNKFDKITILGLSRDINNTNNNVENKLKELKFKLSQNKLDNSIKIKNLKSEIFNLKQKIEILSNKLDTDTNINDSHLKYIKKYLHNINKKQK